MPFEAFDGSRDFLKVSTWLYKMVPFFTPVRATNNAVLSESAMVNFASFLQKDSAAVWRYTFHVSNCIQEKWAEFEAAIRNEFIADLRVREACEPLRQCRKTGSVSTFIPAFRNAILLILDFSIGKTWKNWEKTQT